MYLKFYTLTGAQIIIIVDVSQALPIMLALCLKSTEYYLYNHKLTTVSKANVTLDCKLSFNDHVDM